MPRFDPVVRESTPSITAGKLRRAIALGQVAPGVQLAEAELAKEFGVSRGPLREAMQRLTQEGLLGLLHQYFPKGADLNVYGPDDLEHFAQEVNARPRKTLGWDTLAQRISDLLIAS